MSFIVKFKTYMNNKKISIPFLIVIIGLALAPFIHYSWIASMSACLFLKEDEID